MAGVRRVIGRGFLGQTFLLFAFLLLWPCSVSAVGFEQGAAVELDYGDVWCLPVFDGEGLVVSSEQLGGIYAAKFDLELNQTGEAIKLAGVEDTEGGDGIADHKHIFQADYHYLVFSTSGEGMGGWLYLLKLDRELNRVAMATVASNDPPTNDMLLVGDGEFVYVGKFRPGQGHRIYKYDIDLTLLASYEIGANGPDKSVVHANGASALFLNERFYLVAPKTLAPGQGGVFMLQIYDRNWQMLENRGPILRDAGMLSLVTGFNWLPETENFVVHYPRGNTDQGGPIYRAVYDQNFNLLENAVAIDGMWNRPHGALAEGRLYLGYDGIPQVMLTSFSLVD